MSVRSAFGRRFTFAQACEFLDWPTSRLRAFVERGQVACIKTSQTPRVRKRPGGGTTPYTKTGRVEFYERDLLQLIEDLRTPTTTTPAAPARTQRTSADERVRALLPADHERLFG